jgi:hypothetical protein
MDGSEGKNVDEYKRHAKISPVNCLYGRSLVAGIVKGMAGYASEFLKSTMAAVVVIFFFDFRS